MNVAATGSPIVSVNLTAKVLNGSTSASGNKENDRQIAISSIEVNDKT
jgi:hypothetical protein